MNKLGRSITGAIVPILLLGYYFLATTISPNPFFPPISEILKRFADLWIFDKVTTDVLPSLGNFAIGYLLAIILGIFFGTLFGRVIWLGELFLPLINFGRSVPPIMIIPPLVLLLGIGDASKIFVITIGAFFPIVLTTMDGLAQTDPALVDVSRAMNLRRLQTLRKVYIPAALPSIFGGLQTGMQVALILMVSSEMIAATRGIGYLTMQAQLTFNAPSVWAGILLLALIGFFFNKIFTFIRNRVLSWHVQMQVALSAS